MALFNIRVYGICYNQSGDILVSDELIRGMRITKFPGGGMEFGEGTRDCLKREFLEELGWEVEIGRHIYTTDYFQMSAFNPEHQIISIYYEVLTTHGHEVENNKRPFNFTEAQMLEYAEKKEIETPRWISKSEFSAASVTLPIDKIVAALLTQP